MIDDILDIFNVIDRAEGWLAALTNVERGTHHKRAVKRGMTQISVSRDEATGQEIEDYLKKYHVPVHGKRLPSKEVIILVPSQQADMAKALLKVRGTPKEWPTWAAQKQGAQSKRGILDILKELF